ncbi:MAG: hypothetical protein JXR69_07445 [Candidatus Delongbacteria bacterium]|nr:hypothetical protein [Candidatus Delongbacteria bacterium]
MKKIFILMIITGFLMVISAHSASKVEAKYNFENKLLTVNFTHSVKDNTKHFIEEVKIDLNGKEIISQMLSSQDDNVKGELLFKINDTKLGDVINISAKCNKGGTRKFELVLKKENEVKEIK